MSVYQTIDNVLEAEITPSAKLVAIALFRHENRKTGLCFPSVTTLCELTGLKMTAVKTALKVLRSEGLIEWESRVPKFGNSKTNHYTLIFVDRSESDHMDDHMNDHITNRSANRSPNRTESDHEQREQYKHKDTAPVRREEELTLLSPQKADSKPTRKGETGLKEKEEFELFWKECRRKVNKGQARKTFKKLRDAGELPPIDELCEAMRCNWENDERWSEENMKYAPHPSTWLNNMGWENDEAKPKVLDLGIPFDGIDLSKAEL